MTHIKKKIDKVRETQRHTHAHKEIKCNENSVIVAITFSGHIIDDKANNNDEDDDDSE